jgi:hypothetical protein
MNRPKLFKALRIAWSVVFGLVIVALCVLWVRSYWWWGDTTAITRNWAGLEFISREGVVSVRYYDIAVNGAFLFSNEEPKVKSFDLSNEMGLRNASLPHWFLILACVALAAVAPRLFSLLPFSHRFSLRTLLIFMTAVAVVLGLVIYAVRS